MITAWLPHFLVLRSTQQMLRADLRTLQSWWRLNLLQDHSLPASYVLLLVSPVPHGFPVIGPLKLPCLKYSLFPPTLFFPGFKCTFLSRQGTCSVTHLPPKNTFPTDLLGWCLTSPGGKSPKARMWFIYLLYTVQPFDGLALQKTEQARVEWWRDTCSWCSSPLPSNCPFCLFEY